MSSSNFANACVSSKCCVALSSFHMSAELAARDPEWFGKIDSLAPADLVAGSGVMLSLSSVMLVLTQVLCCAVLSSFHMFAELAARDPEWFEKIDSLTPADLVAVAEEFTKAQVGKVQHGEQQLFICSLFR